MKLCEMAAFTSIRTEQLNYVNRWMEAHEGRYVATSWESHRTLGTD